MSEEANPEAYPEAAALLRDAGWSPHPDWGVYTRGTLVMALQPDGATFHVKDWAMIQPGHPKYGPDTPDTAEEAAAWLVARFGAPLDQGGEMGESAGDATDREFHADHSADAGSSEGAGRDSGDFRGAGGDLPPLADPIDAEFSEPEPDLPAVEGEDLNAPALPEPESLGEEILATEEQGGVAYFGDNLHVIRLAKIGRVTQVASEKKAALQAGWTVAEFASLQNQIMRMDQGLAPDDAGARAMFAAISDDSRAMSAVDAHAEAMVAYLNAASREEVEGFDPEANWP